MNDLMRQMLALCLGLVMLTQAAPRHSRSEAPLGMESSNTVGLGDIWAQAGFETALLTRIVPRDEILDQVDSVYRVDLDRLVPQGNPLRRDLQMMPKLAATFGLAGFMSLGVTSIPWDGEKIGAATARLKATIPGNDALRIFGAAAFVGATLSTEEDATKRIASTPGFDPYLGYGGVVDLDFVRLTPEAPLKLILDYSSLDDHRYAKSFEQHRIRGALEWKGYRGGGYARWSTFLFIPSSGEKAALQFHEMGLGMSHFFSDRLRVTGELSLDPISPFAFYENPMRKPIALKIAVEIPVIAVETRAEASRALIFEERERQRLRLAAKIRKQSGDTSSQNNSQMAQGLGGVPSDLDGLSLDGRQGPAKDVMKILDETLGEEEREKLNRRKKVRDELKALEGLLE